MKHAHYANMVASGHNKFRAEQECYLDLQAFDWPRRLRCCKIQWAREERLWKAPLAAVADRFELWSTPSCILQYQSPYGRQSQGYGRHSLINVLGPAIRARESYSGERGVITWLNTWRFLQPAQYAKLDNVLR